MLATQHALPPRRFLCITATELREFVRSSPIDELMRRLRDLPMPRAPLADEEALRPFLLEYSVEEACAMCLTICCNGFAFDIHSSHLGEVSAPRSASRRHRISLSSSYR